VKVVSESRVMWATSVPILVFLGLSVLDLGPMYATDRRQTDVKRALLLNASALWGSRIASSHLTRANKRMLLGQLGYQSNGTNLFETTRSGG